MKTQDTQTGVEVQLSGTDGNIFAVLGRVSGAMKKAGFAEEYGEMNQKIKNCISYDEALVTIMEYVEVL